MQAVGADSEDYLAIEEDRIAFVGSGPFWLDIEIFELEISSCLNISEQELSSDKIQALESAVDLYIGDLLEGVYQDWCLYDREHLRLLYVNTLHKIMAYHILGGNIPHGLDCGQRLLELDETQELVHRQMMRLYLRQGDRRSAIAQYKHCYQILQQELGISPTRETRDLYREILAGNSISASEMILNPTMTDKGSLIRQALGRLHSLQRSVEETRTELKSLEKVISQVLAEMRH